MRRDEIRVKKIVQSRRRRFIVSDFLFDLHFVELLYCLEILIPDPIKSAMLQFCRFPSPSLTSKENKKIEKFFY